MPDGSLQITRVLKQDAGKYTCMVNNKYGQDMVVHELIVNGPPEAPNVSISSQTTDSVTLKLRPKNPEGTSINHIDKISSILPPPPFVVTFTK